MAEHILPAPPASPESAAFVAAAKEGRFLIRRCTACGKPHWYPRAVCPFCFGETAWEEASGKGVVYSYSVMRRVDPPFAIAYVTLAEGPVMMTNLVDCDFNALKIDQAVTLVFKPSADGTPVPCFTPA
ncbi:MAG: OB-fold domain-containing protein [Acetobacteraceae bacterium]